MRIGSVTWTGCLTPGLTQTNPWSLQGSLKVLANHEKHLEKAWLAGLKVRVGQK